MGLVGSPDTPSIPMSRMYAGFDFMEVLDIELTRGRAISVAHATDSLSAMLSESAASALGLTDPVGMRIERRDNGLQYTVAGVFADIHVESLHEQRQPTVIFGPDPEYSNRPRQLFVARLEAGQIADGVAGIEAVWNRYFGDEPPRISFLDASFDALYRSELRAWTLFRWFSALALFLAAMGIAGLSAYLAEFKTREIGIRKTLGASVGRVLIDLGGDFIRPVMVALALAVPIGYVLMDGWLNQFAYRTTLGTGTLILVALSVLGFAAMVVAAHTVRAALMDPAEALRRS